MSFPSSRDETSRLEERPRADNRPHVSVVPTRKSITLLLKTVYTQYLQSFNFV